MEPVARSSFQTRLHALRLGQFALKDGGDAAMALAADASGPAGDPEVACVAYRLAVKPFADRHRWANAFLAISRGATLSSAHRLRSHQAGFAMSQAQLKCYMGDHAGGVHELVGLASSRQGVHLSLSDRLVMFATLSRFCILVDPDDSIECCLRLGSSAVAGAGMEPPLHWVIHVVGNRMRQFLHSDPAFTGLLRRPELPEPRRAAILTEATDAIGRAMLRSNLQPEQVAYLQAEHLLLKALASRSSELALKALVIRRGQHLPFSVDCEMRYEVAAVLLALGNATLAARVMREARDPECQQAFWDDRLNWMYLRSAVAGQLGDMTQSLALYRQYAQEMSAQMGHMELRVREAVHQLTRLPGARPEDTPDVMPAYLRRATRLLQSAPLAFDVAGLAAAVGVSEKTLRNAFRIHHGKLPKAYILETRLDAARKHVETAGTVAPTVAELAEQFGFSHPGRFAAAYRARFGRSPSP